MFEIFKVFDFFHHVDSEGGEELTFQKFSFN